MFVYVNEILLMMSNVTRSCECTHKNTRPRSDTNMDMISLYGQSLYHMNGDVNQPFLQEQREEIEIKECKLKFHFISLHNSLIN